MHYACLEGGRFAVVPILSSLAVDLLLKTERPVMTRDPQRLLKESISADSVEANPAISEYVARLPEIELKRLDCATGTFRMDVGEEARSFTGDVVAGDTRAKLELRLPATIEGGYWRTPGSAHMAFWKGQRVSFSAEASGVRVAGEAECLVVSADGIRLVTAGTDSPDVMIGFGPCR